MKYLYFAFDISFMRSHIYFTIAFYDPDGYYFDKEGYDEFGGRYDSKGFYHPGEGNKHEFAHK